MKKLILIALAALSLCCAGSVYAQGVPNFGGPMVPNGGSGSGGGVTPTGTFTTGDLIVGAGPTSIQDANNVNATAYTLIGQTGSQASTYAINTWIIPSDGMDCTNAGSCDGWELTHNFGGSTMHGSRQLLHLKAAFTAPSNAASTNTNYTPLSSTMDVNSADGGTNTGAGSRGSFFGENPVVRCNSGATNLSICSGMEVDTVTATGSSMKARVGISSVAWGGAVTGASLDAAFVVATANAQTGANWLNGIMFETPFYGNQNPLATTGCMICTNGTATVATGFDVGSYSISGNFLRLDNNNLWTGAGALKSTSMFASSWISTGTSGQANATDQISLRGNSNAIVSATLRNGNAGAAAQATLYITNDTNSTRAGITLNSSAFSGGQGANALQLFNAGTAPIVLGTGTETIKIGTSGGFTANGSVATVMTSVGPTGSHTTVQKWLTITDNGGVVGYIPVY